MRQAGRYLPEYQRLRKKFTFWEMVTKPALASEVTLQPIERFDLDAAVIFSDIMVILHAMGYKVSFASGGPEIADPLNPADIDSLQKKIEPDRITGRLDFYADAVSQTRTALKSSKSLVGFAAAPYTLASYLLEGKTSKNHALIRALMYSDPENFKKLLNLIADASITYLNLQIDAGVNAVQLFDSWADSVPTDLYEKMILSSIYRISEAVSERVPVIFFTKGASLHRERLEQVYDHGISALSIDWRLPVDFYKDRPVQGNLDPAVLFCDPDTVREKATEILEKRGHKPGFIFNLGHGILPQARIDAVEAMVQTVRNFKP